MQHCAKQTTIDLTTLHPSPWICQQGAYLCPCTGEERGRCSRGRGGEGRGGEGRELGEGRGEERGGGGEGRGGVNDPHDMHMIVALLTIGG